MRHKVIFGDSRLVELDQEIALLVTSPPYFVGREYEDYIKTEIEYWTMLRDVFARATDYIEPYGKVAVNFPDRYANAKIFGYPKEVLYAHEFDRILTSLGFDLWTRIIWDKKKVFIDGANHLAHPNNKKGQMRCAPNWEYVFVWRKHSQPKKLPYKMVDMTDAERIAWTDSIWSFDSVTVNETEAGFKLAKFPEELPYRLIKMYCGPDDFVLDPFAGTCTVAKAADALGRGSICIELNHAMEPYIRTYLDGLEVEYLAGKD